MNKSDILARMFEDPVYFMEVLWIEMGLDSKAPLGRTEKDMIAYTFRTAETNSQRRRVCLAFRGAGKTTFGNAGLSANRLFRDPERKILIVSKSQQSAKETCQFVRSWIDACWFLQHLRPREGQPDTTSYFTVGPSRPNSKQPSVKALGVDGQLEGNRAHTIIVDDVETKKNTVTLESREALAYICTEFTNIMYNDIPKEQGGPLDPTEIVYYMTPKHEETLALKLLKKGYSVRAWPIAYPRPDERVINLAPMLQEDLDSGRARPGDPTTPHRFGPAEIAERQAEGYTEYAREHMLIADLADTNRYPLRLRDLIVMDVDTKRAPIEVTWGTRDHNGSTAIEDIPVLGLGDDRLYRPPMIGKDWVPYSVTKMAIDPSGSGTDRTGIAIGGSVGGVIHVKVVEGLKGGYDEDTLSHIAEMARTYGVQQVYIERNFGGGMFDAILAPILRRYFVQPGSDQYPDGWSCVIIDDPKITTAYGAKEERIIETLEPVISTHRLVIDRRSLVPKPNEDAADSLQYQLTRVCKEKGCLREDGKLDALSLLIRAFKSDYQIDPHKYALNHSIKTMQHELERALKLPKGIFDKKGDTTVRLRDVRRGQGFHRK